MWHETRTKSAHMVNPDRIKVVRKRLATGEVREYVFHRASGRRLHAQRGSPEFWREVEIAKSGPPAPRRVELKTQRMCPGCGKMFEAIVAALARGESKHCSRACASKAHTNGSRDVLLRRGVRGAPGECWIWPGALGRGGYGVVRVDGRQRRVHRVSYAEFVGPIPDEMYVCHRCDNPACWNPAHLFIGTAAENSGDRDRKGRSARGEKHRHAKLTGDDVRAIRASRETVSELSRRYGVRRYAITQVIERSTWKHIE